MADEISIENLYKKSYLRSAELEIDEIYRTIKDKVLEASKSGAAEIYFDLPDNFAVGNLELKDAQLVIYCGLMERLERSRLKVSIIPARNGNRILHIKWPAALDEQEKARMKQFIKDHIELDIK